MQVVGECLVAVVVRLGCRVWRGAQYPKLVHRSWVWEPRVLGWTRWTGLMTVEVFVPFVRRPPLWRYGWASTCLRLG